jgi:hypothetical protein
MAEHNPPFPLTTDEIAFIQNLAGLTYAEEDLLVYRTGDLTNLAVGSNGEVLTVSGGLVTWAAAVSTNSIEDADGDTKIQVEESADEDIIRFDTAGSEAMTIGTSGEMLFKLHTDVTTAGPFFEFGTNGAAGELTGNTAQTFFKLSPIVNHTGGSGSYTIFSIDVTETATDNTVPRLFDFQIDGVRKFQLFSTKENWNGNTLFEVISNAGGTPAVRYTEGAAVAMQIIADTSGAAAGVDAMVFDIRTPVANQALFVNQTARSYAHADRTDPAVYIHSRTPSGTATNQYLGFIHDTTDGHVECGFGDLILDATVSSNSTGLINMKSGFIWKREATAVSVTVDDQTSILGVTSTAAARTVTLPSAESIDGRVFVVKDESGGAGTNNITVATEGSENIDGASTFVINSDYGSAWFYSDGSNWFTI